MDDGVPNASILDVLTVQTLKRRSREECRSEHLFVYAGSHYLDTGKSRACGRSLPSMKTRSVREVEPRVSSGVSLGSVMQKGHPRRALRCNRVYETDHVDVDDNVLLGGLYTRG